VVKILITNATILTLSTKHELVINNGYLFIDGGVIKAVGSGEVPEELQYPELLISGKGRLVVPGLSSGYTRVSTYPLRYVLKSLTEDRVREYLSTLSRTDVYYSAILSFTDLLLKGVTTLMISDIYLDDIARAAHEVGLFTILASPIDINVGGYDPYHELKLIMQRWHGRVEEVKGAILTQEGLNDEVVNLYESYKCRVFIKGLKNLEGLNKVVDKIGLDNIVAVDPTEVINDLKIIRTYTTLNSWRPFQGLGIGDEPSYNLTDVLKTLLRSHHNGLDILFSATNSTTSIIGLDDMNCIEVGKRANIVIYNFTGPPGWPLLNSVDAIVNAVIYGNPVIESVIVGDNILLDGNEVLNVGVDLIKKATNRLEGILRDYIR
jgi:cytosine/adenosine deaminase-related metal-dependent hydrolase